MIINKELHPRSDVAQLYVSRKNGGWGFTRFENKVKSEENDLGWYFKNNIEPLLAAVRTSRTIHKETVDPKEFKKTKEEQRKINGLQIECLDNLPEIWRTRLRTHGDWWEKVIWKDWQNCRVTPL